MRRVFAVAALALAACAGTTPGGAETSPGDVRSGEQEKPAASGANASRLPIVESFIGTVPVHPSAEIPEGEVEIATAGFSGDDYGELGRRAGARRAANGRIRVALERLSNAADPVEPRHRACSFLIDCDEPSVVRVAEEAGKKLGREPGPSALAAFVDEFVTDKSLARAQDLPSQTAQSRSGDCTEHALLFVALARRFAHASRDVSGFVLIAPAGQVPRQAFGHAWAEVHDGKRWRRVDPSLGVGRATTETDPTTVSVALALDESGQKAPFELRYVPLRVRGEEGPAYERDDERGLTGIHVEALYFGAGG